MSDYLIREIEATPNITVCLHTEVTDGHGADHLDALTLHDRLHDKTEQIPAAALFVQIGGEPRTQWLPDPARARLHPDRARRRAGRRGSVAVATRSRASSARDLHTRHFRRRRRPLPLDQAGCVRRG